MEHLIVSKPLQIDGMQCIKIEHMTSLLRMGYILEWQVIKHKIYAIFRIDYFGFETDEELNTKSPLPPYSQGSRSHMLSFGLGISVWNCSGNAKI
jgi:hypothetical protein